MARRQMALPQALIICTVCDFIDTDEDMACRRMVLPQALIICTVCDLIIHRYC